MAVNDIGDTEALLAAIDETIKDFNDGDIVEGVIVKVDRDEVPRHRLQDRRRHPARELSIKHDVDPPRSWRSAIASRLSSCRRKTRTAD